MASGTTLGWETLPEELLRMIFKHSTLKCLVSCMTVNKRWKDIALDYIESYSLWPKLATETMANKGRTFKRKSVLGFKDMLLNSLLWPFVPQADIKLHHTYPQQDITSIQVLKESMILTVDMKTSDVPLRYFDIPNTKLQREFQSTGCKKIHHQTKRPSLGRTYRDKCLHCRMASRPRPLRQSVVTARAQSSRARNILTKKLDMSENEYMRVSVEHVFFAFGKENPNDPLNCNEKLIFLKIDIFVYRLEGNVCYIVTKGYVIWALTWDLKRWDLTPRGRCYGSLVDLPCGINLYNDKVCLVTRLGFILYEDRETMLYQKQNKYNLVPRIEDSSVLVLFSQKGVAISVRNSNQRVKFCQEEGTNVVWLECGDMTCATEHGAVLFMGYKDGSVAICTPHTMTPTHAQLDRLFNVREFDNDIEDPTILAVEVFEDKLSHHLLVATQHKVLQFLITYPDHIRSYFD